MPDAELDEWRHDVAGFVQDALPAPPARVLEVGCGDGWLVRALHRRGYDVHGIDPEGPADDPLFSRLRLEDFAAGVTFDTVVAVLPLHHIADLDAAVGKIEQLLVAAGTAVCIEFAWDRFDDATARWCLDRLPAEPDEHSWLRELCRPLRERMRRGRSLRANELVHAWAAEHGFHSSTEVLEALRVRFVEQRLVRAPYLYPELDLPADVERAAIEAGQIAATSFRFVGRLRG